MSSIAIPLTVITNLDIRNNFSIFAIANEYAMTTKLINIGNSRGIVIPAKLLKKYKVDDNASVSLEEENGRIYLKFSPAEEEPYTGPFTGPFKALKDLVDEDAWGGKDMDPVEYVRQLRDDSKAEKRVIDWGDF